MAWQRKIPFGYQVRNGRINCHPGKFQFLWRLCLAHRTVVDTGIIFHRIRHTLLHHIKKFISHTCTQHTDMRLYNVFRLLECLPELLFIKSGTFIFSICFRKTF